MISLDQLTYRTARERHKHYAVNGLGWKVGMGNASSSYVELPSREKMVSEHLQFPMGCEQQTSSLRTEEVSLLDVGVVAEKSNLCYFLKVQKKKSHIKCHCNY